MSIIHVTAENFEEEVLKSEKLVFVSFTSDTCGPCKALAPTLANFAESYKNDVKVVEVNCSKSALGQDFGIISIPAIVAMKDGKGLLKTSPSTLSQLEEFLENARKAAPCTDAPGMPKQKYVYKIDTLGQKAMDWPPLHMAVLQGNVQRCKEIIAYNPSSIDEIDGLGHTALMYVSVRNTGALLDVLIAAGADINQKIQKNGQSTLLHAAYYGSPDVLEAMLARGADLMLRDNDGKTALDHAHISLTTQKNRLSEEQKKKNDKNVKILTENLPRFHAAITFLEKKEAELKAQPLKSVQKQPKP